MSQARWLVQLAAALGVAADTAVPAAHGGDGRVALVDGLGVVKVYARGSKRLRVVLGAAEAIERAGVDVAPRILTTLDIDNDDVAVVFERVVGDPPAHEFLRVDRHRQALADLLARLHGITGPGFTRDPFDGVVTYTDWPSFAGSLIDAAPRRYESAVGLEPPKFYLDAVSRTLGWSEALRAELSTAAPALVHRDVSAQNLIVGVDGSLKLIDFELAAFYDPFFDFVKLELFHRMDDRSWSSLVERYCSIANIAVSVAIGRIKYSRALELIWGYPTLVQTKSQAAPMWETHLREMAADDG